MEHWKPITGYEGIYSVSDQGRIRRDGGPVLATEFSSARYPLVQLCRDGMTITRNVHRLVALAFVPAIPGKPFVNHKDGVRRNCNATNLEWNTRSENMQHAVRTGLVKTGTASPIAIVTDTMRAGIRSALTSNSQRAVARMFGVSQKTVWRMAK